MRVRIVRAVARFCRARAEAANRRAFARRFVSAVVLLDVSSPLAPPGARRRVELDLARLERSADRDARAALEWAELARQVEELAP